MTPYSPLGSKLDCDDYVAEVVNKHLWKIEGIGETHWDEELGETSEKKWYSSQCWKDTGIPLDREG